MPFLHKKNKRISRYEAISNRNARTKVVTQGNGLYVYRNRSKHASLTLPKKCKDGRVEIPPNGEFEGDDYFDILVKNNTAIRVRTIEEKPILVPIVEKKDENMLVENKLILDQPETVTTKGTVENVVVDEVETVETKKKKTKKNESAEKGDILLTDGGLDGIQILG